MSIEAVAKALHVAGLTQTQKLVLIGIANHDGDGGAWPAIATLARYAGCSPRHARRCVRELEDAGWVTTYRNQGGTADTQDDRRPNRYRLHLDGGTQDVRPDTRPCAPTRPLDCPSNMTPHTSHTLAYAVASVRAAPP